MEFQEHNGYWKEKISPIWVFLSYQRILDWRSVKYVKIKCQVVAS